MLYLAAVSFSLGRSKRPSKKVEITLVAIVGSSFSDLEFLHHDTGILKEHVKPRRFGLSFLANALSLS